jgi:DUF4097 and DUF4098 domain-containing protein YvlB
MTLTLLALALASAPEPSHLVFDVGADPEVSISNISGEIHVTGEGQSQAVVDVSYRGGTEAEQRQWDVAVQGKEGKLEVRVCCGKCPATNLSENGGHCNGPSHVDLNIKVPTNSHLAVANVSGHSLVEGVKGELSVTSVSGRIEARGSSAALSINTVSGGVSIEPAQLAQMNLHSVSGNFEVKLPSGSGAEVNLHSVSGALNGQSATLGDSHQTVGRGGPDLRVTTVSGNVDVH